MRCGRGPVERFARATAVAAALCAAWVAAPVGAADTPSVSASVGDAGSEVVFRALSLLGVNYRFGGNSPETGLDCSGLVRLVYSDALGLPLPRRSEEISRVGPAIAPTELQPGDLVFFNTLRRAFSHVGIYIGNNQFVHAPSTGGSIRVENLDADYWTRRFDGARRLLSQDLLAAASMNPLSASAARAMQASTSARLGRPAAPVAGAPSPALPQVAAAAPAPAGSAFGTRAAGWSAASAPVWAATDGIPAAYGTTPAPIAPSSVAPPAAAASVLTASTSATIEARTAPLSPGSSTLPNPAPPSLAATTTLAAAPIMPPASAPSSASTDARVSTGPVAARPAASRTARSGAPRAAKATTVRTASKPARRTVPPARAPASVRAEGRASEQRVAARPARGDVFVN